MERQEETRLSHATPFPALCWALVPGGPQTMPRPVDTAGTWLLSQRRAGDSQFFRKYLPAYWSRQQVYFPEADLSPRCTLHCWKGLRERGEGTSCPRWGFGTCQEHPLLLRIHWQEDGAGCSLPKIWARRMRFRETQLPIFIAFSPYFSGCRCDSG